jgi:hypothetical protein
MSERSLIQQKIKILKSEIQDLINVESIEKQNKIIQLQKLTEQLKSNYEYSKAVNSNNSIVYHNAKKNPNSNEIMNNLKEKREKSKLDYTKYKEIEAEYFIKESNTNVPAYILFSKEIIEKYSYCPFIELTDESILIKRKEWIDSQSDSGEIYYNLYNKIVNESEYMAFKTKFNNLSDLIENDFTRMLNKDQKKEYLDIKQYLIEYTGIQVKTKKLKDLFKIIINNVSNLVISTTVPINSYLSLKYDSIEIPINNIRKNTIHNEQSYTSNEEVTLQGNQLFNLITDRINELISLKESIRNSHKWLINNKIQLKEILINYLITLNYNKDKFKYQGKYFKKWSQLTNDEKIERLTAFSEYYVYSKLIQGNLIGIDELDETKITLQELLLNRFNSNLLKYKHIKWNVLTGLINNIIPLKYISVIPDQNNEKNFKLELDIKIEIDEIKNSYKKSSSIKTIMTKNNEKIINEEIIVFILKNNENQLSNLSNNFCEYIKLKLKLKRITLNDKTKIIARFNEIYTVIQNNKLN